MNTSTTWRKFKLPLIILLAFVIAAIWVGVGRLLFGVFGWMAFITLFMFAPVIVLYGVVLAIVVAARQRVYRYRKQGPFMLSVLITLGALFCVGFFMPDGGDIKESFVSPLSTVLLNRNDVALIGLSGTLAGWSAFVAVVAAVVTLIMAFAERPKKPTATPSLKQPE